MLIRSWRLLQHENVFLQGPEHRLAPSILDLKRRPYLNLDAPAFLCIARSGWRCYNTETETFKRIQIGRRRRETLNQNCSKWPSLLLEPVEQIRSARSHIRRSNSPRGRNRKAQLTTDNHGPLLKIKPHHSQNRIRLVGFHNERIQNPERTISHNAVGSWTCSPSRSAGGQPSSTSKTSIGHKSPHTLRRRRVLSEASKTGIVWKQIRLQAKNKRFLLTRVDRSSSASIWRISVKCLLRWSQNLSVIDTLIRRGSTTQDRDIPRFIHRFERFLSHEATADSNSSSSKWVSKAWVGRSTKGKSAWWCSALLLALTRSPMDALDMVRDICKRRCLCVPEEVIQDVLQEVAVAEIENGNQQSTDMKNFDYLVETACFFLARYSKREGTASLHQRTIWNLSKHCDAKQIAKLLDQLSSSKAELTVDSKCHLMRRFLRLDRLDSALDLLRTIPQGSLRDRQVQSLCVLMLRASWEVDNLYAFRTKLLSHILEIGVRPNTTLRNVIMLNAMEAGDRKLAWDSFHVTEENGLLTSAYTFSILLKGVDFGDDLRSIDLIYRKAKEKNILALSPWLGAHFLYAVHVTSQRTRGKSFDAMLPFYEELFELAPLEDLGIVKVTSETTQLRMKPGAFVSSWMVIAWITDHIKHPDLIEAVYKRYLQHTSENHPIIAPLAGEAFVAAAFILAFGQHRSTVHMCTTIMQDMLKPHRSQFAPMRDVVDSTPLMADSDQALQSPAPTTNLMSQTSKAVAAAFDAVPFEEPFYYPVAPPNVHTWNALLLSLVRHKQVEAAEKVMSLMRSSGIQPNTGSWNRLISGYANLQQAGHVVESLGRMGQESLKPDEHTVKMLGRFENRTELLAAFRYAAEQQAREENALREEETAVASVEEPGLEREGELASLRALEEPPVDWLDYERMKDAYDRFVVSTPGANN